MKTAAKFRGQFARFILTVKGYGLANVVHNHLTRIALGKMIFQLLADRRINAAVNIVVEQSKEFTARGAVLAPEGADSYALLSHGVLLQLTCLQKEIPEHDYPACSCVYHRRTLASGVPAIAFSLEEAGPSHWPH